MLCCGAWNGTMSKRDYKTSVADGMELEPLGGTEAVDKENSKTNGTQFGAGKCFEYSLARPEKQKRIIHVWTCACACVCAKGLPFFNLIWPFRSLDSYSVHIVQCWNYSLSINANTSRRCSLTQSRWDWNEHLWRRADEWEKVCIVVRSPWVEMWVTHFYSMSGH